MKKLYICEYPYNLYKLLIERMGDNENSYSVILSDVHVDMRPMVQVLRQSGLFECVEFFPSEPYKEYYQYTFYKRPKSAILLHLLVQKNRLITMAYQRKFKDVQFPFKIDFAQFDKIVCSDDAYVINGYLNSNHIAYTIFEHARGVYQNLQIFYDLLLCCVRRINGIGILAKYCQELIVDTMVRPPLCMRKKRITIWNVQEHIDLLTADEKDKIFQVYADAYHLQIDRDQKYSLLLTNPLFYDGYVSSEKVQIQFYQDIIQNYFDGPVLIKPHPRDTLDYKKYFPHCTVINQNISSEVLMFSQYLKLSTVLTLFSTSVSTFEKRAERIIKLESHLTPPDQMASLKGYR